MMKFLPYLLVVITAFAGFTWLNNTSFKHEGGKTAKIELQDASLKKVADWTLRNVMPVKWSIVAFDAAGNKVATETLELAHTGFLDEAK